MDWKERIAIDPKVMGGKPVVAGTRVPVHTILAFLAGGDDLATICEQFDLTDEDVRAALAYAADVLKDERVQCASYLTRVSPRQYLWPSERRATMV